MTPCIFSQAEFIDGKGWDVTIVMGDFTHEEKKNTITYLKSKADKMELFYNNKHITAYEIVSIGTDSIEVELLNEWGYRRQILFRNCLQPSSRKSISNGRKISKEIPQLSNP